MTNPLIETEGWTFFDWIQANTRAVSIAGAVVVIGGLGIWFYGRSGEIKRANAERGLNQAKQSMVAGNPALALNDLQRVATRYKGTPAGAQAAMLLAQLQFDQSKFAEGLQALEPYQNSSAAGPSLASIWSLTGDGLFASEKPAEAGAAYQKAADATKFPGERSVYRAKEARALMAAGKNAEAKALWEKLATDRDAIIIRNEAQMRLGELAAQAAGKS